MFDGEVRDAAPRVDAVGAMIACVGQMSCALQLPQCAVTGSLGGSAMST